MPRRAPLACPPAARGSSPSGPAPLRAAVRGGLGAVGLLLTLANGAAADAAPLPAVPCDTMARLREGPRPVRGPAPPRPPTGAKGSRDAYGVRGSAYTTENFIIRWGPSGGVTLDEITRLGESLEASWAEEVVLQGHPAPDTTDDWLFNVYIGDSGGGAPSSYGSGGWYSLDGEGWPLLVVAASSLDTPDFADITAAHEFYHAVQDGADRYGYEGLSAWLWEATAVWASATVFPENSYYAVFLFGYVLFPHYPVNFFDYYDTGALPEYYQYGSFLWPWFVSEQVADRALIQELWTDTSGEGDPLEVMRAALLRRGLDLDEVWLDHIAANATWAYPDRAILEAAVAEWVGSPEWSAVVADTVGPEGTAGWVAGPEDLRPMRYGSNAISIAPGEAPALRVRLAGEASGSARSPASWGGRVVAVRRGAQAVYPLAMADEQNGEVIVPDANLADELWLVVGAWTAESDDYARERFRYAYAVEPHAGGGDGGSADDGGADGGSADGGTDGSVDGSADGGSDGGATDGSADGGETPDGADAGDAGAQADGDAVKLAPGGCAAAPAAGPRLGLGLSLALGLAALGARRRS